MSGDPLLVLACSATKSVAAGNVPAFERYDGPLWRTLRAALHFTDRPVRYGRCPLNSGSSQAGPRSRPMSAR